MPETKPHKIHTDIADQYACDICNPPRARYGVRGTSRAVPPITTAVFALEAQTGAGIPVEQALSTYCLGPTSVPELGRVGFHTPAWDHAVAWIMTSPYVNLGVHTPHIGELEFNILKGWRGRVIDNALQEEVERWLGSAAIDGHVRTWLHDLLNEHPGRRAVAITTRHNFTSDVKIDG